MASYTDQDTDGLLPGEPWTSAKALAAFENPLAIAEGAAGAPKIQTAAYGPNTVNENAMKVLPESSGGSLVRGASESVTIAGNLVFIPRLTGDGFTMTLGGGGVVVTNSNEPPDEGANPSEPYTVTWYRIVP
jgi:hypothetical protein